MKETSERVYFVRFVTYDNSGVIESKTATIRKRGLRNWTSCEVTDALRQERSIHHGRPVNVDVFEMTDVRAQIDGDVYLSYDKCGGKYLDDSLTPQTDALMSYFVNLLQQSPPRLCYDTLRALVLKGPLEDGDIPSKSGRDILQLEGLAERVVVNGQEGFNAATSLGYTLYKRYKEQKEKQT